MFFVYILRSLKDGIHYYGYSSNLQKRIEEHNDGLSNFTNKHRPWEIIYFETFDNRSDAMKREKFFKSLPGFHWLKDRGIIS